MPKPLVSVIIPAFNGEKYIAAAIESVLAQDYINTEIIIVDDGSTDNTADIVKNYAVRYSYQENKGIGAARNTGVRIALGTHFAFLDHDDLWTSSKLTLQMQLWNESSNDPLVFGMAQQFICPEIAAEEQNKIILKKSLLPGYIASALLVSKKRFDEVGFFREEKTVGEFIDWYVRSRFTAIPTALSPEIILKRRLHTNNMGRQQNLYPRHDFLKIIKEKLNREKQGKQNENISH